MNVMSYLRLVLRGHLMEEVYEQRSWKYLQPDCLNKGNDWKDKDPEVAMCLGV